MMAELSEQEALQLLLDTAEAAADKLRLAGKMVERWKATVPVPASVRRDARRYRELCEAMAAVRGLKARLLLPDD